MRWRVLEQLWPRNGPGETLRGRARSYKTRGPAAPQRESGKVSFPRRRESRVRGRWKALDPRLRGGDGKRARGGGDVKRVRAWCNGKGARSERVFPRRVDQTQRFGGLSVRRVGTATKERRVPRGPW